MKCSLIIPAWRSEDLFPAKTAGFQINYWEPLGTLYVAAALRQTGHEVQFLNGAFLDHEALMAELVAFRPNFAGIYATAFGWPRAALTAGAIKERDPNVFVCAGGPYPIAKRGQCLRNGGRHIDAVVTGEAEQTVPELVARLQQGRSPEGVRGVAYRQGRHVVTNPPRPLIEDLDALPFPARDLLGDPNRCVPPPATYRRKPVAVMLTSRGCSRRCIFCFQIDRERQGGARGVRFRSIANVVNEIEQCLQMGYREIKFVDDSFAADYRRAMALTQEIRARRLDFTWFASACVNQVDEPLLRAMKAAGCWAILLGAESGVQKNLNTLRKGITLDQTRAAVRAAKKVGLKVSTPFVFGIPGETYEDGVKTIEFAAELAPDLANFHALTAFPGTYLHDNVGKYGTVSDRLSDYNYQGAAFVPYSMTREQIQGLRQKALRHFYSRPSFLFKRVLQIRSWNDCLIALKGIRGLFWLWATNRLFERKAVEGSGGNTQSASSIHTEAEGMGRLGAGKGA